MAITLRYTTTDTTGKTSELSYQEMNNNLKSYFYSSSLNGEVLNLFYLTGSQSQSIDLSTFVTQLESGSLLKASQTGSFYYSSSVRLNTITFYQGDGTTDTVTVDTGSGGVAATVDTGSFYYSSSVNLNTITFYQGDGTTESVTVDTGSGGSGTPGGSDTYVQFNDGGSTFGGDSGLTYNKTSNRLTITAPSSPTRTAPNLLLNSELGNVTVGEVLGVIASNNATDQYSPASYPASIQFTADTNFSPGNYDARIGLFVNNNATETEALRLRSSGQNQLPQYGSGTFTGTVAKYLAVSASGDVIETDVATGANVTRPGSDDQNITFIEILANQQAAWNLQSTSGATPTSTNVTADSATVSSITALKIHHTADFTGSFTGDVATALDQLAYGGTVQIGDTGEPSNYATATVRQVVDNGTYHTIYTSAWNSTGLTTLSGVFGLLIGFDTDKIVVLDDKNYNRIKVNNDCGNTIGLRFKANPSASPGDYYYVEVTADSANSDNMLFEYIHNTSGTGASYVEATNNIYYHNNAATLTQLNVNSTYQQAVVEFRVTPSGNLALMGADKVLR